MAKLLRKFTKKTKEDSQISDKMKAEASSLKRHVQALILGAGGSGKSTILKQMEKIHNGMIPEIDMQKGVDNIRKNIIFDMCDLCEMSLEFSESESYPPVQSESDSKESEEKPISSSSLASLTPTSFQVNESLRELRLKFIKVYKPKAWEDQLEFTPKIAEEVKLLWADKGIQTSFAVRRRSHIMDNTNWLMERVDTVADPGYQGSFDAYIRVRDRTTGVIQHRFNVPMSGKNWVFQITDVGGQRAERRKWAKLFDDSVNCILYVMSLSGYDQVLFEDHEANCYDESFKIFKEIASLSHFKGTDFCVFLNKVDVFDVKIDKVPFTVYEDKFKKEWAHDRKNVVLYVQQRFVDLFCQSNDLIANEKGLSRLDREISFHVTCSLSTTAIEKVISAVQLGMVNRKLRELNLVG